MFQVGDAVVHPVNGAGIVTELQKLGNQHESLQYYRIKIMDERNKTLVMMPVKQAESLGLRYVIPKIRLKYVWEILQNAPDVLPSDHKKRYSALEEKLDIQDTLQYAEIVRDLEWRRLQEGHLNIPGKRIYNKALRLLIGELALSQEIPIQEAEAQVKTILAENLSARQLEIVVV
ncbi:MAG: CarD family transcriptional regulator [Anaerolineae bacterium]